MGDGESDIFVRITEGTDDRGGYSCHHRRGQIADGPAAGGHRPEAVEH